MRFRLRFGIYVGRLLYVHISFQENREGISKYLVKRKALGLIKLKTTEPDKDMVPSYPPLLIPCGFGLVFKPFTKELLTH